MSRNFSKSERLAAYLFSNGKSMLSGKELGPDFHADHIISYNQGGATNVSNIQTLTALENLTKLTGIILRNWQKDGLQAAAIHDDQIFNTEIIYGAGKTYFGLAYFTQIRTPQDLLIVVSPTVAIQNNWVTDAAKFGVHLDNNWYGTGLSSDFQGISITYQGLRDKAKCFQLLASKGFRLIVLLDECHHNSDTKAYGNFIKQCFASARKIVNLSGTFFRHDGSLIFGGEFEEERYKPDFEYTYSDGLRDNILRPVKFLLQDCAAAVADQFGNQFEINSIEAGDDNKLTHIVKAQGVIEDFVKKAFEEYKVKRAIKNNAAVLLTAADILHAEKIKEAWIRITKLPAVVVTSDDNRANEKIDHFRESWDPCIIAVKMVSEGISINRICVIGMLSPCQTALFFRQLVGRGIRKESDDQYLFDCSFIAIKTNENIKNAKHIEEAVKLYLKEMQEKREALRETSCDKNIYTTVSSGITSEQIILSGENIESAVHEFAKHYSQKTNVSYPAVLEIYQEARSVAAGGGLKLHDLSAELALCRAEQSVTPIIKEREALQRRINKQVCKIAKLTGQSHDDIHTRFNRKINVFGVKDPKLTLIKLKKKMELVSKHLLAISNSHD